MKEASYSLDYKSIYDTIWQSINTKVEYIDAEEMNYHITLLIDACYAGSSIDELKRWAREIEDIKEHDHMGKHGRRATMKGVYKKGVVMISVHASCEEK